MAVLMHTSPPPSPITTVGGVGGGVGGIIHQGTLLNALKNIFHDHGMKSFYIIYIFLIFFF